MRRIELAEFCAGIFGETEGDVVRFGITAYISERKDGDKDFFLHSVGRPKPAVGAERDGAKNSDRKQSNAEGTLPFGRL